MASMVQAKQTNRAAPTIKAEAAAAHQTSAEPLLYPPPRAVENKSIYLPLRAREGRQRAERIPLGIICMLAATILIAGSSALSKWLVATYPIGEMLFVRAAVALVGSSLAILPATGLSVFRTKRLRDHMLRGISHSCAQTSLVIAFSLMPLASAVAINSSAPLFATVASVVFLKETVGPVRWGALIVGFLGVLLITSPGVDTFQAGSLFALANAILFGTVTVGVRGMTATESTETSTIYQMVFLTAFFAASSPFGWMTPTLPDWGAMVVNGLGYALGQYLWTRALHLAPTSAVVPFNYFSLVWAIIWDLWCGATCRPRPCWWVPRSWWGRGCFCCGTNGAGDGAVAPPYPPPYRARESPRAPARDQFLALHTRIQAAEIFKRPRFIEVKPHLALVSSAGK
jgi:drug/metabolite transporter (DMT)-like permease